MKSLSKYWYEKSTIVLAIILTIISFGYLYLVMVPATECYAVGVNAEVSLGTSFGFTFDTVRTFLSSMNDEMLDCYRTFNTIWDNIFAMLYGLMYVAWLSLLFKPWAEKAKWLNLFPFLQTIFDWLENAQLSSLAYNMGVDDEITETSVQVASIFSMSKWGASAIIYVLILAGIVLRVRKRWASDS